MEGLEEGERHQGMWAGPLEKTSRSWGDAPQDAGAVS